MPPSNPLPTSMVAWQHTPNIISPGALEKVLKLNQTAAAPPLKGASSTLVKVLSSGINPIDYKLAEIPLVARLIVGTTATPCVDYVGRVWATNLPESNGIKPGDLVFGALEPGDLPFGTLGSYVAVSNPESMAKAPSNVDLDELASVGTTGFTAYVCLVPDLEKEGEGSAQGKSVFINGGSGGVGTFAIQIAKAIGCEHIVVSCSGSNAELVRGLGATEVIDYRSTTVIDGLLNFVKKNGGRKFDHVADLVGGDFNLYYKAHEYMREGGKYMMVGGDLNPKFFSRMLTAMMLPGFLGGGKRKFEFLAATKQRKIFERIGGWMGQGKVKAVLDSTYPMEDARQAFEKLKTHRAKGNIVVRVSEDGRGAQ